MTAETLRTDSFNPVAGWDVNPFFGGSVVWNSPAFQPVRSGTGNMGPILNLAAGTLIDASSVFSLFTQGLVYTVVPEPRAALLGGLGLLALLRRRRRA